MTDTPTSSPTRPLLVFGDDGSAHADVAWLWINNHRWPGWRLETVTASEPPLAATDWTTQPALEEWTPPWGRDATQPTEAASIRWLTGPGDPRLLLGERADADLLVVGPRGFGHLRALWSGSITEWLLHHPPAPLAVVVSAARVEQVVVCVDGSEHAQAAVEAFTTLPLAAESTVTVVTVDDGRANTAGGTASAMKALDDAGVVARSRELEGKPTDAIGAYLDQHRPQLVVMGTRGLTGLARLRLGSTAAAVVRGAGCSSLVACSDIAS